MFLDVVKRRNEKLIEASIQLHQEGKIPANSYVVDIDTVEVNADILAREGKKHNLKVFAMTKQIGRNPAVLNAIKRSGIDACVAVDMNDARPIHATGLKVGHLGHLVQVPHHETQAGLKFKPDYWTVFSKEKAEAISKASRGNHEQKILARIHSEGDVFYKGHEGGFNATSILGVKEMIDRMENIKFSGITTFPAQLFNLEKMAIESTPNMSTLCKTAEVLRKAGMKDLEINAPGTTSSMIFEQLASHGITQVEPGNSLAGTVPIAAFRDIAEAPAMVYVSEVSHIHNGKPYCYGGGMYIDPVFEEYDVKAFVGSTFEQALKQKISCDIPDPSAIDYYGILKPEVEHKVHQGDTVVFGFRAQTFVTRAYMVPVSGIHKGALKVEGIYTTDGRPVGWPEW